MRILTLLEYDRAMAHNLLNFDNFSLNIKSNQQNHIQKLGRVQCEGSIPQCLCMYADKTSLTIALDSQLKIDFKIELKSALGRINECIGYKKICILFWSNLQKKEIQYKYLKS